MLTNTLKGALELIFKQIHEASNNGEYETEIPRELTKGYFDWAYDKEDLVSSRIVEILFKEGFCVYRKYGYSDSYTWYVSWDKEKHEDCEEDHSLDYTR